MKYSTINVYFFNYDSFLLISIKNNQYNILGRRPYGTKYKEEKTTRWYSY